MPTWAGIAYVCFITDAFSRMIVGWRVAGHMRTTMVLDTIEMARWTRGSTLSGLRCHSDAGSQFTSIRYGERLAEIGAVPSIGTVGDSFDNALAEAVNGYYKSELIYGPARPGPWRTVADVELATLGWVHWHNTSRLHGYLDDIPPAEFEATFYATKRTDQPLVGIQLPEPPSEPIRTRAIQATPATALRGRWRRAHASPVTRADPAHMGAVKRGGTIGCRRRPGAGASDARPGCRVAGEADDTVSWSANGTHRRGQSTCPSGAC